MTSLIQQVAGQTELRSWASTSDGRLAGCPLECSGGLFVGGLYQEKLDLYPLEGGIGR